MQGNFITKYNRITLYIPNGEDITILACNLVQLAALQGHT